MTGIAEPLRLSDKLYSSDIISQETNDRVFLPVHTATEKNRVLLDAIEARLKTNPSDFWTLVATLEEDTVLKTLAGRLRSTYRKY